jgi:flavin-dependent dehydrogenase
MPDAIGVLAEYGLWDEVWPRGHSVETARLYSPSGAWVDLAGKFLTIPRLELDELLLNKAIDAGAVLISGADASDLDTVTAATGSADGAAAAILGFSREGRREELRVRLAILACGARTKTLSRFGVLLRQAPSAIAMRAYFRLRAGVDDSRLQFFFAREILPGYGWIFPMGDGLFNIGVGIHHDGQRKQRNLRDLLAEFLTACEVPREMIRDGTELAPFKGAPLRMGLAGARPSADRLLVCGESVGATHNMSGEGIGKAMQTASVAADHALAALSSDKTTARDLARYDEDLERRFRAMFASYRTGQRWLFNPVVCNYVIRRARSSLRVRGIFEGIVAETESPTELLSLGGILKALVLR